MASDLKSDLVSKSYDMGPHVKLMGNPAVVRESCFRRWSGQKICQSSQAFVSVNVGVHGYGIKRKDAAFL